MFESGSSLSLLCKEWSVSENRVQGKVYTVHSSWIIHLFLLIISKGYATPHLYDSQE